MNLQQNRREFLRTTAVAALSAGLDAAMLTEAVEHRPLYEGPIIDTHTHFYDPTRRQGVPWPPKDDVLLYRRVLPPDYIALPKPQPVTGTVVVEASAWVEDNQWILDLAASQPFIRGFVGNLAPGTDDFRAHLRRFAANPVFRGIRIGADRVRQGLSQSRFVDDLKLLASRDLAVDWLGGPDMLPDVARLARAVPELRLIIDHVANIRIPSGADPRWRDGMRAAGQQGRVYCKVSGLVEGTGYTDGKAPAEVEFYRPVLDELWEAFGSDRLVYGSNWPVSERFAPCAVVQQIVTEYFQSKGRAALEKVFCSNAQALYHWGKRP